MDSEVRVKAPVQVSLLRRGFAEQLLPLLVVNRACMTLVSHNSFPVREHNVRYASDSERVERSAFGIDRRGKFDFGLAHLFDLIRFLGGETDNTQLLSKLPLERIERRDGLARWNAPRFPKYNQNKLALESRFVA